MGASEAQQHDEQNVFGEFSSLNEGDVNQPCREKAERTAQHECVPPTSGLEALASNVQIPRSTKDGPLGKLFTVFSQKKAVQKKDSGIMDDAPRRHEGEGRLVTSGEKIEEVEEIPSLRRKNSRKKEEERLQEKKEEVHLLAPSVERLSTTLAAKTKKAKESIQELKNDVESLNAAAKLNKELREEALQEVEQAVKNPTAEEKELDRCEKATINFELEEKEDEENERRACEEKKKRRLENIKKIKEEKRRLKQESNKKKETVKKVAPPQTRTTKAPKKEDKGKAHMVKAELKQGNPKMLLEMGLLPTPAPLPTYVTEVISDINQGLRNRLM